MVIITLSKSAQAKSAFNPKGLVKQPEAEVNRPMANLKQRPLAKYCVASLALDTRKAGPGNEYKDV